VIASSPAETVQKAIFERLSADTELADMGVTVTDDAAEAQTPYVVIGAGDETPDNAHDQFGRNVTEVLDIWSGQPGFTEANRILDRICQLLDHQPIFLTGHRGVAVRFTNAMRMRDPSEPFDRHIAAHFLVVTAQTE
jgi:hypothetical protein